MFFHCNYFEDFTVFQFFIEIIINAADRLWQNGVETNDPQCQSSNSTSFSADTVGDSFSPEVPNIFTKYINKRETTNNTNPTPRVQLRKYLEEIFTMTVLPSN